VNTFSSHELDPKARAAGQLVPKIALNILR
jgi:hypothetical protein